MSCFISFIQQGISGPTQICDVQSTHSASNLHDHATPTSHVNKKTVDCRVAI